MTKKIETNKDKIKLKNLWHLRNCNIKYGEAKRLLNQKNYSKAIEAYEHYISKMNSADLDAHYDLAQCFLAIAMMQDESKAGNRIRDDYVKKGIHTLKGIQRDEPDLQYITGKLKNIIKVYTKRSVHRRLEKEFDWNNKDELTRDELRHVIAIFGGKK
tara:strand:- start:458 stop:931 length:474 start_codon:yes stop_codon:yes gene_type:complete